jgi:gas vesicle protein
MGQDPRVIEREIEQTREHMGETVQALANKADVPGRMRRYVGEKREAVVSTVSGAREVVYGSTESVSEAGHDLGDKAMEVGHEAGRQARRAGGVARENPVGLAVGAAAVGFLAGTLLPRTRFEDEQIGEQADQLKDRAREIGESAVEHGKAVASDAADAAMTTAKDSAGEHTEQMKREVSDEDQVGGGHIV